MADTINFEVIQGDTFSVSVVYKDYLNNPVDLTGYSAIFKVKDSPGGKIVCATATNGNGVTFIEDDGVVQVQLTPAQTKKFTMPKAAYQLQITSPSGVKETLISGWIAVSKAVI